MKAEINWSHFDYGKEPPLIINGVKMSGVDNDEWDYLAMRVELVAPFDWLTPIDRLPLNGGVLDDGCYGMEWVLARGNTVWLSSEWYKCYNCNARYRYMEGWAVPKDDPEITLCIHCADYLEDEYDPMNHYTETVYG